MVAGQVCDLMAVLVEFIASLLLHSNMKRFAHYFFSVCTLVIAFSTANVMADAPSDGAGRYTFYPPSMDATGKVFMGREIAYVMGFQGAAWLERQNRVNEERTDVLVNALNLKPGMQVADIGAGTGFLSREMAKVVGAQGQVFAVDLQPEMLGKLKALQKTYPNITPVLAAERKTNLTPNSTDIAIMVDVYHELAYPYEVMQDALQALKPHGQLVLVEYRGEDDRVPIKASHKMTEAQIIKEMRVHGLRHEKTIATLPWQHIVVFTKP